MSIPTTIELDFGRAELKEDGILRFFASYNQETITLNQLKELQTALLDITKGEPLPFYSDNSKMKSLGYLERQYIGKNLHLFASASAVKENSGVIRFIGHSINHMFPPKVPMKMFSSEKKAVEWLKSLE